MADRYIGSLNPCTDPTAGDKLWIEDASAAEADKDRSLDVARLVTQDGAGIAQALKQIQMLTASIGNGLTHTIGAASFGLLVILNVSSGAQGLVWLGGGANSVASVNLRGAIAVTDAASNLCVIYQAGTGYVIKNNTGSTASVRYLLLGV